MQQKQRRACAAALICGTIDASVGGLSKGDIIHILPASMSQTEEVDHIWNEVVSLAEGVMNGPCVVLPWSEELVAMADERPFIRELAFMYFKGQS